MSAAPRPVTDEALRALALGVGERSLRAGLRLATAESCTGGWVAKACTDLPGSSGWFVAGFVTYSDAAKTDLLGVPAALVAAHGAVSEPVVRAMAEGALARGRASRSVAISGIAGPAGGSAQKPVGTVWFAWSATHAGGCVTRVLAAFYGGDREAIRRQAVAEALAGLAGE